jgi:hypothetical protein
VIQQRKRKIILRGSISSYAFLWVVVRAVVAVGRERDVDDAVSFNGVSTVSRKFCPVRASS